MQYSTAFVSLLAAAASAMPTSVIQGSFKPVTVTLRNDSEKAFNLPEPNPAPTSARPNIAQPVSEVKLTLRDDVQNKDLRCQVLDDKMTPIVLLRGENADITFSDADKGPWMVRDPAVVSKIICDPTFVANEPTDERLQVKVLLQSQNPEVGINFDLSGVIRDEVVVREETPFETVTLSVSGSLVDPDLRCQIVGAEGPIVVLRGENVDVTFSDAGKGEWTLQEETVVQKIICDPAFVAASV